MPRPKWRAEDQLTPFARLIRAWMWRQSPPMTVPQLADKTGLSKQAIWGWFQHDAIPRRDTVIQLASRTGLDVDELLRAAGLPDTRASARDQRLARRAYGDFMRQAEEKLRGDTRLTAEEAETFLAYLRGLEPAAIGATLAALAAEEATETQAGAPVEAASSADDDQDTSGGHPRRRTAAGV